MHFRDLPIRRKLTWVNILTSSVALLLASVAFIAYEAVTFREGIARQLSVQAQIIGDNSASALMFNDREAAVKILAALRAEPHIIVASVYGKDGIVFATYARKGTNEPPILPDLVKVGASGRRFEGNRLIVAQDIFVDSERVGSVRILSDLNEMTARMLRYLGIVALVFLASAVAAVAISSQLQQVISRPILHLVERARIVSTEQNYSVRAIPASQDELGLLTRTFNEMLSQIEQRDVALEKARDDAEAGNRAKDEFLAVVSHELRTPLTPILMWARMLRGGRLDTEATASALETIERNIMAQAQLVGDLLDVSRIITGKLRLDVRPVDIVPVVEAAAESARLTAELKGVRLRTIVDPRAGFVAGDPDRLQQIVWNLLSNAIKFTDKGGRVQVEVQRVNSHVRITVSDSGQGISAEFLPHVFDRFRQADSTTTRAHGGLGLGLAIVRHLVELHGGRVHVASPGEGQGATFTVELPLAAVQTAAPPEHVHPTAETRVPFVPSPALARLRLLVVDDDVDTLETLQAILSQCGAEVRTAASAAQALEVLEDWRPDLLISDLGMPGEDGYTLLRRVRALDTAHGGDIPALALTAYARAEDRVNALAAGFQMHVAKPIEPAELVAVIANLAEWTAKPGSGHQRP
jgi:signal transduction histidine kinase/ActR/RegA family two-component response regulator